MTLYDYFEPLQSVILGSSFGYRLPEYVVLIVTLITRVVAGVILIACVDVYNSRLCDALAAQRRAMGVQTEFLSSISHELRTPLNGFLGNLVFLKRAIANDGPGKEAMLYDMEFSATAMLGVVNDILDIAKINNCKMVLRSTPVRLAAIVQDAVQSVSVLFSTAVRVRVNIQQALPEFIVIDGSKLRQILVNFLSNAAKFTARGTVDVHVVVCEDELERLQISVTDTGRGISDSENASIFQQFVQADHGVQGTGLGLSICKTFAEMMSGNVGFNSDAERTTFWVKLPLHPSASHTVNISTTDEQNDCSDLTLLVAEDNMVNQRLMMRILETLGCTYIMVDDGEQAVDAFLQHWQTIDCILMDCSMPVVDGFEATKRIRQTTKGVSVPIVAVTASVMDEDQEHCRNAGMDGFVGKPVSVKNLVEELRRLGLLGMHGSP